MLQEPGGSRVVLPIITQASVRFGPHEDRSKDIQVMGIEGMQPWVMIYRVSHIMRRCEMHDC